MTIRLRQTGASTSEATIRSHKVAIHRPLDKGARTQGPGAANYSWQRSAAVS